MAKTRRQTRNETIQKEEEDCKSSLEPDKVTRTTRNTIAKRTTPKNRKSRLPAQDIKVEEDTDTKALLQLSPTKSNLPKGQQVSQEQIDRLIDAIVNDKMGVRKAALKANISRSTAYDYYNIYKNHPEKRIPSPRIRDVKSRKVYMQQDIENLIAYIEDDKMSVKKASEKASMTCVAGSYYYNKYLQDPDHNIPIPYMGQRYTQDQREVFIGYIVNDKMSIRAAAKRAGINNNTGRKYCREYFKDKDSIIPAPSHIAPYTRYTQEQIKDVIRYIVNGKMSIKAASRKINVCSETAKRYYYQYLKDNNMELPAPRIIRPCTQEDKNELIRLIFDEKLSIKAAAKKVTMSYSTSLRHYQQYVKNHNIDIAPKYTQDQINQLIRYIMDDKMTKKDAAKKANMPYYAAEKYYLQYLNDNNIELPGPKYTQVRIDEFIGYIVDNKMSKNAASRKANIPSTTASRFYRKYLMHHNLDVPVQKTITQDNIDEFISYIVDDKMSIKAAAKKANMGGTAAYKYYRQYQRENNLPVPAPNIITQDQINALIGYIVDDKMSVNAASKKANMTCTTGSKYYQQYLNSQ